MRPTIKKSIIDGASQLSIVTDCPQLEAEVLLAFVLNKPRAYLHAWSEIELTDQQLEQFSSCLQRRCFREPIAYITGKREFWSLDLSVTHDTLIPRPETELLVECVLKLLPEQHIRLADLGTGSGAIALALAHEQPTWQIDAVDVSQSALLIASKNAQQLGLNHVSFYQGNWCTALPCKDYDVIVSNPPYIAESEWEAYAGGLSFEPQNALVSGRDGLDAIREIGRMVKSYLKPSGYLLVEHGFGQGEAVRAIFTAEGYAEVYSVKDLLGHERVTIGRMPC